MAPLVAPAPAAPGANLYAAPYGYPAAPPRRGRSNAWLIVALGLVAVLALGVMGVGGVVVYRAAWSISGPHRTPVANASPLAGPVDAQTKLVASRGKVVFSDDFSDPTSGWYVGSYESGTTTQYGAASYMVAAAGTYSFDIDSPYAVPLAQASALVVATQNDTASQDNGFGVYCFRGNGATGLMYELVVTSPGEWSIARSDGPFLNPTSSSYVRQGSAPVSPGSTPNTIVGMCAQLADGVSTRLAIFVNGILVADVTDESGTRSDAGWLTGVAVWSSDPKAATVTFTRFEERDLSR